MEQSLILTEDELRILLYSQGYRQCEGIYMPPKEFSSEEVIKAILHLTKNGLIREEGETFQIREDVRSILPAIGDPAGTMVLKDSMTGRAWFCYLLPDRIVVAEKDWKREHSIRLQSFRPDEFHEWKEQLEYDHCEY